MKRREFFKGILATAAVLATKPLANLFPKSRYAHYEMGYESMGSGALDTVESTDSVSVRVGNPDVFFEGQEIEIYGACSDVLRGHAKISRIVGSELMVDSLPAGTVPGDLLLLPSRSMNYYVNDSCTGTFEGLARS